MLQYLKYAGLEKSVNTFESECFEKGTPISSTEVTPKASEKLAAVQVVTVLRQCILQMVGGHPPGQTQPPRS